MFALNEKQKQEPYSRSSEKAWSGLDGDNCKFIFSLTLRNYEGENQCALRQISPT
jgi:hypothetical protein